MQYVAEVNCLVSDHIVYHTHELCNSVSWSKQTVLPEHRRQSEVRLQL